MYVDSVDLSRESRQHQLAAACCKGHGAIDGRNGVHYYSAAQRRPSRQRWLTLEDSGGVCADCVPLVVHMNHQGEHSSSPW